MKITTLFNLPELAALCLLGIALVETAPAQQGVAEIAPTHAKVVYLEGHKQNVLDLWLAESDAPTPLAIYIHGGGFRGGSMKIPAGTVERFLDAGISVASVEYRFIQHEKLPVAHHDCRLALQFLRANAEKWNIDKEKIGAWGGSAGAQLSMYLAFHDEMANPKSADAVARESTRLICVATNGGQATIDLDEWIKWVPGYDKHHRDLAEYFEKPGSKGHKAIIADISAIDLLSKGDPPLYMTYRMGPDDPVPEGKKAVGWSVHHVVFGQRLGEKMDELGIESHLVYPGTRSEDYRSFQEFLIAKLRQ